VQYIQTATPLGTRRGPRGILHVFCQGAAVQRRYWTVCHNARSRTSLCRLSNRWHYVTELGSIVAQRGYRKKLLKVQIPKRIGNKAFSIIFCAMETATRGNGNTAHEPSACGTVRHTGG